MSIHNPRILIWDLHINIKNSGGPAGYLYNWKEYLKTTNKYKNIHFLKDILGVKNITDTLHARYKKIIDIVSIIDIFKLWPCINFYRKYKKWRKNTSIYDIQSIDLNQFDVIHFHVSFHLTNAIPLLKNYKGKIVLTTHCPEPFSEEACAGIPYQFLRNYFKKKIERIELDSWERSDFMMFPVEHAIEPYCNSVKHKEYLISNKNKLIYCPTSIFNTPIANTNNIIKEKFNLPDNAFVITYIGRHSIIKGYDQLVNLGKLILDKYPNVYFVIAGYCFPNQGLNHPHWIELGWINYGAQLILNSDLFVLPNKETYFDIIALEVLRSGTPMMMSDTGGNKFFKTLKGNDGLRFFKYGDLNQQVLIIEELLKKTNEDYNRMRKANVDLFNSYFTMESFFYRYNILISQLLTRCNE